jgi:hypothetical protein
MEKQIGSGISGLGHNLPVTNGSHWDVRLRRP